MEIRRKRYSAADGMLTYSCITLIYLWITILHPFVCFPTLELAKFEQWLCSTKIVYANTRSFGKKSRKKKRNVASLKSAHQAKEAVQIWQWLVWTTTEQCSTEWTRTSLSTGLVSKWKNTGGPCLFKWSMLFFRASGCCIILTKLKAMSLCLS